ncbi:MAG: nitrilase [Deltaproteobacteria bacterium]|nr:nitrilase [Deltaproteobacteria bacterium]
MNDIRVALVIFRSSVGQVSDNLDRMVRWVRMAGQAGADVVCFPEMNISGYSVHSAAVMKPERIPGPASQRLSALAKGEKIAILAGMAEMDGAGLYASHILATPDGQIGVYRKLHIPPPEQGIFSHADQVPVFSIKGVLCGVQLCYDIHFPELSMRMAVKGADVIFSPHASPRGTPQEKYASWMRHLPARAYDNGVFVLACNQTGDNGQGLHFPGLALAIGPDGHILKKDVGGNESLLLVLLKAEDMAAVRNHRMRYFLPNRRPELYHSFYMEESR